MKFIHFESTSESKYPVGARFESNVTYIKLAASAITKFARGSYINIALICRGTSGSIIAGGVGYILSKRGFHVTIVVSRKEAESSHDYNMSGMLEAVRDKSLLIVIDDFIDNGYTIFKILEDIEEDRKTYRYDEPCLNLCVSNIITNTHLNRWKGTTKDKIVELLNKFDVVLCNR